MKPSCYRRPLCLLIVSSIMVGFVLLFLPLPAMAAAFPCPIQVDQSLCVQTIKRSAKYPWEFRLTVAMNGHLSHWQINCRDRTARNPQGLTEAIKPNDWEQVVCRRLKY